MENQEISFNPNLNHLEIPSNNNSNEKLPISFVLDGSISSQNQVSEVSAQSLQLLSETQEIQELSTRPISELRSTIQEIEYKLSKYKQALELSLLNQSIHLNSASVSSIIVIHQNNNNANTNNNNNNSLNNNANFNINNNSNISNSNFNNNNSNNRLNEEDERNYEDNSNNSEENEERQLGSTFSSVGQKKKKRKSRSQTLGQGLHMKKRVLLDCLKEPTDRVEMELYMEVLSQKLNMDENADKENLRKVITEYYRNLRKQKEKRKIPLNSEARLSLQEFLFKMKTTKEVLTSTPTNIAAAIAAGLNEYPRERFRGSSSSSSSSEASYSNVDQNYQVDINSINNIHQYNSQQYNSQNIQNHFHNPTNNNHFLNQNNNNNCIGNPFALYFQHQPQIQKPTFQIHSPKNFNPADLEKDEDEEEDE